MTSLVAEPDHDVGGSAPPVFDAVFRARFAELVAWRRDVRRFLPKPVDRDTIGALLALAAQAPSVGNAQPWRFVMVDDPSRRAAVRSNFERCNAEALLDYAGERAQLYTRLKLEGLAEAPVHIAAFCDERADTGHGLGRRTMPETLHYSVVTAIHTFWLAARTAGLGVGWISILDPGELTAALEVPAHWRFIGYLCVGYPCEEHLDPELVRHGWQDRLAPDSTILER
ncbi:5,6-dimethylbenzimidazole synthase [Chelatococcus daeguensis]|uniref:5,6-dimethylbenzimidazole synthase n=1 Tax=Chelatococcus daeguensis TaxID=444444 RepID=UPI001FD900D0|nr:5,6-dimethylbenzimidazole synthase [Chelatococcus daeguensis]